MRNLKFIARGLIFAFLLNALGISPIFPISWSAEVENFRLPVPGTMVSLSPAFAPPILKGIKVHPDNPFRFEFILDKGDSQLGNDQLKDESTRLVKYFLASLTIPEKDLWVNLSPYEKDRIVPEAFGQTEMGRDLLAEDYMLKQITASLIYPEGEVGKRFWKRIYEESAKKFGTTNIPVNTFNKVWIVPEKAVVYENAKAGTAYVVESKLKVMLEQDYLALSHNIIPAKAGIQDTNALGSQIVREIVIPELTKEVNDDKNFAQLRQVYNSLILATWYKKKIKDSILEQVYADKKKVAGVSIDDPQETQRIYQRYLQAFKKGVYNYIKEDIDPVTQETIPRKYFSGGATFDPAALAYHLIMLIVEDYVKVLHKNPDELLASIVFAHNLEELKELVNKLEEARAQGNKIAKYALGLIAEEAAFTDFKAKLDPNYFDHTPHAVEDMEFVIAEGMQKPHALEEYIENLDQYKLKSPRALEMSRATKSPEFQEFIINTTKQLHLLTEHMDWWYSNYNFSKFIFELAGQAVKERKPLMELLRAYYHWSNLDILRPLFWEKETREELFKNRLNNESARPSVNRPLAIVIYPKTDWLGFLTGVRLVNDLIKKGYKVMYYEVSSTEEMIKALKNGAKHQQASLLVITGHGSPDSIEFGNNNFLTREQKQMLAEADLGGILKPNANGVLQSCSTGGCSARGENIADILAYALRRDFLAPMENSYLKKIIIYKKNRFAYRVQYESDGKRVKTYKAKPKEKATDNAQTVFQLGQKGGIDLTPANMNLQVRIGSPIKTFGDDNGGIGDDNGAIGDDNEGIKFHLTPVMLEQLQNAPGFVPVIINIQPMTDLRRFLGIQENSPAMQ